MDTKEKAEQILYQGREIHSGFAVDVAQAYITQQQEAERLKELICVAQDYLKQHWDMRSIPLYEIDDIANKHIEESLKDKQ